MKIHNAREPAGDRKLAWLLKGFIHAYWLDYQETLVHVAKFNSDRSTLICCEEALAHVSKSTMEIFKRKFALTPPRFVSHGAHGHL